MFENKGYFKEYYINGKYVGMTVVVDKDREIMGYFGSKDEITDQEILLSNNKKIKSKTKISTQLHYLNGKKN